MDEHQSQVGRVPWNKDGLTVKGILVVVSMFAGAAATFYWTQNKNSFLEQENASLTAQNASLLKQNNSLSKQNGELTGRISDLVKHIQKSDVDEVADRKAALDLPAYRSSYEACSSELQAIRSNNQAIRTAKSLAQQQSLIDDRIAQIIDARDTGWTIGGESPGQLPDLRQQRDQLQQRILDIQARLRCPAGDQEHGI